MNAPLPTLQAPVVTVLDPDERARVDAAQGRYQPLLQVTASANQQQGRDLDADVRSRGLTQSAGLTVQENIWRGGQDAGQVEIARQDESIATVRQSFEVESLSF